MKKYFTKRRSAFNFTHLVEIFSEALKHVLVSYFIFTVEYENFSIIDNDMGICRNVF